MEELFELRSCLGQGRYTDAIALIGEMEDMSRDDKINNIQIFTIVLLILMIKKEAEKRSARSWELSIRNAVRQISRVNRRGKAGGYYLKEEELRETVREVYEEALDNAAIEAFEGRYSDSELAEMVDEEKIRKEALQLLLEARRKKK